MKEWVIEIDCGNKVHKLIIEADTKEQAQLIAQEEYPECIITVVGEL